MVNISTWKAADAALTVVTCPAEVDPASARSVGEALAAAIQPGSRALIADMTQTTFCDSSAIRMLAQLNWLARENGTEFRLVAPVPAVRRVLQMTGLIPLIPVYATVSEALAA
jgi:anti-anti-sigma factor